MSDSVSVEWLCQVLGSARASGARGIELVNALAGACEIQCPSLALLLDDVVREERDAQARLLGPLEGDLPDNVEFASVLARECPTAAVCRECGGPFRQCGCGSHYGSLDLSASRPGR